MGKQPAGAASERGHAEARVMSDAAFVEFFKDNAVAIRGLVEFEKGVWPPECYIEHAVDGLTVFRGILMDMPGAKRVMNVVSPDHLSYDDIARKLDADQPAAVDNSVTIE